MTQEDRRTWSGWKNCIIFYLVIKLQVSFIMSTFRIMDVNCNNIFVFQHCNAPKPFWKRERERKRDKIKEEERGQRIVGSNGGSLNGERGRMVLDREGGPMAASQWSDWPFAARLLPITLKIDWKSIRKQPRKQDSSILPVFWPGGGLNPYLIIITHSEARRGVRGGQLHN